MKETKKKIADWDRKKTGSKKAILSSKNFVSIAKTK